MLFQKGYGGLFTRVRGRDFLRPSPVRHSRKFTLQADPPLDHRLGWLRGSYRICVANYFLPPGCGPLDSRSRSLARGFRRGRPSDDFEG
jgi:hypothetical protein